MNYPWIGQQTLKQFLLNTFDMRMYSGRLLNWFYNYPLCECSWQIFQGKLMWIPLGGCPLHD